jgi:energy-coupling factor transport system substrate-specific component
MKRLPQEPLVATIAGIVIFFVLGTYASIEVFKNTYVFFQYSVLCLIAMVYGPFAGALVGFVGHTFVDIAGGGNPYWSWVAGSCIVGIVVGIVALLKRTDLEIGRFGAAEVIWFNVASVAGHIVAWGGVAPSLEFLIDGGSFVTIYTQALIAGVANIVTTSVVGTLLLFLHSKLYARVSIQ